MAKGAYVGIETEIPIYDTETVNVTADNIGTVFTVTNGSYYFAGSGGTFTTNNGGVNSSTATTTLTALKDMDVRFTYSYSSEAKYDKFTLKIAGNIIENAVSGTTTTKTWSGTLSAGQTIEFTYAKDSSTHSNDDKCTFSAMTCVCKVQTGTTIKSLARKIKKGYIGIPTATVNVAYDQELIGFYNPSTEWIEFTNFTMSGNGIVPTDPVIKDVNSLTCNSGRSGVYAIEASASSPYTSWWLVSEVYLYDEDTEVYGYKCTIAATGPGIAHKIRKAYIGIGGVARPCWSGGELTYYGTITSLSVGRDNLAATTVGNYALFGGGGVSSSSRSNVVDAYDKSLTRTTASNLSNAKRELAATTVGGCAIFAGGYMSSSKSAGTDAYDSSLTKLTISNLSIARDSLAATTVGNYALFGGGDASGSSDNYVDAYDSSLTRSTPTVLSGTGRTALAATTVGNYAIFAGGGDGDNVDAYDSSLTKTVLDNLSQYKEGLAATTVGNYALFGGGGDFSYSYSDTVDAYDSSLTRSTPTALSIGRYHLTATSIGDYALFGAGAPESSYSAAVDAYDSSLTRTNPNDLSKARYSPAATTIGNYALFGGGYSGGRSSTVDAYTIA